MSLFLTDKTFNGPRAPLNRSFEHTNINSFALNELMLNDIILISDVAYTGDGFIDKVIGEAVKYDSPIYDYDSILTKYDGQNVGMLDLLDRTNTSLGFIDKESE